MNKEDTEFDAMQEIFDMAHRQQQETKAHTMMENARTVMVMGGIKKADHTFFATLVFKLKYLPDWTIPTAATDGERMIYNPEFMLAQTSKHVRTIHAHEVLHNVCNHPAQMKLLIAKGFDQLKLNIAMDAVVNWILKEAGYDIPEDAVLPGRGQFKDIPPNLTTLETYRLLKDKHTKGYGDGSDIGGMGGVLMPKDQAGTESGLSKLEQTWKMNVAQAENAAKMRGTISAGLERLVGEMLKSKVNWREVLRDFLTKNTKTEYTWSPPNRRFMWQGIYLPRLGGQTLTGLIIANDTSGSMDLGPRSACASEIEGICQQVGCSLTILHHDSAVCSVQKWEPSDGKLVLAPKGGGGTSHIPVFDWIEQNQGDEEISALICLTDMYSSFPSVAPSYPVLWVSTQKGQQKATPFGTYLEIDDETP